MTIHKEGRILLVSLAVLLVIKNLVVFNYFDEPYTYISLGGGVILFLLILQFFRNPKVSTVQDDAQIYAPADGKVVAIEPVQDDLLGDKAIQISIFMSPLNVHVNRTPVGGVVKKMLYNPGKYLVAWHPKSSSENERNTMVVETPNGNEILVRQIAGAVARRIKWYVTEGDIIDQGQEFGFIKFGSRVDVLVPLSSDVLINIGDKTKAGKTILAVLPS